MNQGSQIKLVLALVSPCVQVLVWAPSGIHRPEAWEQDEFISMHAISVCQTTDAVTTPSSAWPPKQPATYTQLKGSLLQFMDSKLVFWGYCISAYMIHSLKMHPKLMAPGGPDWLLWRYQNKLLISNKLNHWKDWGKKHPTSPTLLLPALKFTVWSNSLLKRYWNKTTSVCSNTYQSHALGLNSALHFSMCLTFKLKSFGFKDMLNGFAE